MWYHVDARLEAERKEKRRTWEGLLSRLAPRRMLAMHTQVRHAARLI
jgi:hypothetical protein